MMAIVEIDDQERAVVWRGCTDHDPVQRRRHVLATVGADQYVELLERGPGQPDQRDDRAGRSARAGPPPLRQQRC
jgi:hypothetical protein